jgi:uncharacterized protein (TIGR02391 family)
MNSTQKIKKLTKLQEKVSTVINHDSDDPDFINWKNLVERTLGDIYGNTSHAMRQFKQLKFYYTGIRVYPGNFSGDDLRHFNADFATAQKLIAELLEEEQEEIENIPPMPAAISDGNSTQTVSITGTATIINNLINITIREEIYNHIKQYLDDENYFHAVSESYKVVREKLKSLTTHEKATDVFNMNAENKKYYNEVFGFMPEDNSPEADFCRGVGYLNLAVQFLRNEKEHALASALDKNLALHYISLASLAYDLISRVETKNES